MPRRPVTLLNHSKDDKQRAAVIVDFAPLKGSKTGELAARFEIVMGFTPAG